MTEQQIQAVKKLLPENRFIDTQHDRFPDYLKDETILQGAASLVALPQSHDEVRILVKYAHAQASQGNFFSITTRGGGSGLSGAAVPASGLVLSIERMNRLLQIDTQNFLASAEAGIITAQFQRQILEQGLCYPVDVSSAELSTLGGNIATNAAGPASLKYGTTRTNLAQVRVVWADGTCDTVGALPRKTSTGIDLLNLIVGSEGRLCIVTEATVRLSQKQPAEVSALIFFETYEEAAKAVSNVRKYCASIKAIEFIDEKCIALNSTSWPEKARQAKALLLLDFEGTETAIYEELQNLAELIPDENMIISRDTESRRRLWVARKSISSDLTKSSRFRLGEDIAVPIAALPEITRYCHQLSQESQIPVYVWGHAGDGNLHVNFTYADDKQYESIQDLIVKLAGKSVSLQGSVSGEHGLGRLKKHLRALELSPNLIKYQDSVKRMFDPLGILNPALG